jgi:hypothetical protein
VAGHTSWTMVGRSSEWSVGMSLGNDVGSVCGTRLATGRRCRSVAQTGRGQVTGQRCGHFAWCGTRLVLGTGRWSVARSDSWPVTTQWRCPLLGLVIASLLGLDDCRSLGLFVGRALDIVMDLYRHCSLKTAQGRCRSSARNRRWSGGSLIVVASLPFVAPN